MHKHFQKEKYFLFLSVSAILLGAFLCGCARNESELRQGITTVFDVAATPAKILVRQMDNGLDHMVKEKE